MWENAATHPGGAAHMDDTTPELKERHEDVPWDSFLAWLRANVQLAHADSFARLIGVLP
jgi:hypothetical protein